MKLGLTVLRIQVQLPQMFSWKPEKAIFIQEVNASCKFIYVEKPLRSCLNPPKTYLKAASVEEINPRKSDL